MSRQDVLFAVDLLEGEQTALADNLRVLLCAVSAVGGGWTALETVAAGKRRSFVVGGPGDRDPRVPWSLPSGLLEYDANGMRDVLAFGWLPLARRWLLENRTTPFACEETK